MRIRFLGVWSSNSVRGQRNVSFLLDDKMVFDFGPHSVESLLDMGVDPNSIETVFITHMHLDHFSGIPELLWYRAIYHAKQPLFLVGPRGIKRSTETLLKTLNTPEAFDIKIKYIEEKDFDSVQRFHANHIIPDNGYRIEYKGKVIFYSGDTAYSENVVKGAENADYLIHEMTYTDARKKDADFWKHSTYSSTLRVFQESKARHLIPVHLTRESSEYVMKMEKRMPGLIYPRKSIPI